MSSGRDPGFLVKIEEVVPNYQNQPPRRTVQGGFFLPPNQKNGFTTRSERLLRYKDRLFHEVAQDDPVREQLPKPYKAATVFSQATRTDHLLTVPFDAREKDVNVQTFEWRNLSFEYLPAQNGGTLASLVFVGDQEHLPARVPELWQRLIPHPYRYQKTDKNGNPTQPDTTFAGLIGCLPFLVALAAFSARQDMLIPTLRNLRSTTGRWVAHNYSTGRQSRPNIYCPLTLPGIY